MSDKLPVCRSFAECSKLNGKRVEIVGKYVELKMGSFKSDKPILLAGVEVSDKQILLGAFWRDPRPEEADEKKRLLGKQVRVRGTFHTQHPNEPGVNKATSGPLAPTVQPVESITEDK